MIRSIRLSLPFFLFAAKAGDSGAQVRLLTNLGVGLRESHMYEESLSYFDNALKVASTIPDLGYPFAINEARLETLVELNRTEDAQRLADEILTEARQRHHPLAEAIALTSEANIAAHRNDNANALPRRGPFPRRLHFPQILQQAMALSERPRATFSEL